MDNQLFTKIPPKFFTCFPWVACQSENTIVKLCLNLEDLQLSTSDQQMLSGQMGLAQQKALSIVARMAKLQGATSLVDVKQVRFMTRNAEMVSWRELVSQML